ncbi:MAG: hypothetical protein HY893_02520 [Deltaproteobacteria bacterium]|nr:hypothetical protein [Deltaproteobacteria bacterium]
MTGAPSVNHKYTSQELDSETGLYYYGARYYNPALGKFISPDSMVPYPVDPQVSIDIAGQEYSNYISPVKALIGGDRNA